MAYSREHMKEWLASAAVHCRKITDQLVREIKLGTAEEWTAYELMRAAERELGLAAAYLGAPISDEYLAPVPSMFEGEGDPEPDEDRDQLYSAGQGKTTTDPEKGHVPVPKVDKDLDVKLYPQSRDPEWDFPDDGDK